MNKCFLLPILLFAALSSCNNAPPSAPVATVSVKAPDTAKRIIEQPAVPAYKPDLDKEAATLQHKLQKYEVPSQHLTTNAKAPSIVKGAAGTRVLVVPKDMVTPEGQPVTENIDVELKEMPGIEQMLAEGAQTVSNGRLLVSGGAYYVNMTSGGQQLSLKLGKTLKVSLPKRTDGQMNLFYGERDADGTMNWRPTPQQFKNFDADSSAFLFVNASGPLRGSWSGGCGNDPQYKKNIEQLKKVAVLASLFDEKLSAKDTAPKKVEQGVKRYQALTSAMYNEVALQNFGWINCDRFLGSPNLTTLACGFDPKDSISYAKIYLAFKSINSLREMSRYAYNTGASFSKFTIGYTSHSYSYGYEKRCIVYLQNGCGGRTTADCVICQ